MASMVTALNSVEPITVDVRLISVDEFSEHLTGPELPAWAEEYLAGERQWWRLLRGTGAVTAEEAQVELRRWTRP